jgi:hypothetical protein
VMVRGNSNSSLYAGMMNESTTGNLHGVGSWRH